MVSFESEVPALRLRALNQLAPQPDRKWVVYWMTAFRRTHSNYALQRRHSKS